MSSKSEKDPRRGLRAGTAEVVFDLPPGLPMMGYGARVGAAKGTHDPLHARALYLERGGRALIVQLEVCLLAVPQARALARRIAERTGLADSEVWIAATHTHSGPETGIAEVLAGREPPDFTAGIFTAAEAAAVAAVTRAFPARIGLGRAHASIGRNRRASDGEVDDEVTLLRVDDAAGTPRAVAFVHGTHPTVLGHENLAWSADWPGAAGAELRRAFPDALPLFLLGAHGDVDPRTRGLQDLAVPGQSLGAGFDACESLGRELGRAVVAATERIATSSDVPVSCDATTCVVSVHGGAGSEAVRAADLASRARAAAEALGLPPGHPLRVSEALSLERGLSKYEPDERRERLARVRLFVRDRTATRMAGGARPDVDVHVLTLGDARWLGLPAEATAELGLAWKAQHAPGSALLSNVGGWLRYLPHPARFSAPDGHHHYEVLMSTLEPDAARRLLEAGNALASR